MDYGIKGQVAIVTGGGRGIGATTCEHLAREGAVIGDWDRDEESADQPAERIRAAGGQGVAIVRSVESADEVADGARLVTEQLGPPAILVNNAGFSHLGPVTDLTDAQWSAVLQVHMTGAFNMVRAVVPQMKEARYGRIINMSSLASLGADGMSVYAAVK